MAYGDTFSESLGNKLPLLDEVGIDMTAIGRNFCFPQCGVVDRGGGGGGRGG